MSAVSLRDRLSRLLSRVAMVVRSLTVMMTKMRKYLIHRSDVIRYRVIANEVLPVLVAKSPKAATMMVLRLIFSKFPLLIVAIC